MEKSFTLSQIKAAFWEKFHEAGELWFDYLGNKEDNESCTNSSWEEFFESLEKSAQQPLAVDVCRATASEHVWVTAADYGEVCASCGTRH